MGKSNTELLKIAQKHLGEGGAKFRKFAGLTAGAAWCNAFVDYIANEGGVKSLYFNGKKETNCPHSIKWCKANLADIPLYLAQPMDIIYFDWDKNGVPNHIGFVRAHKSTDTIYTIEGNTGNKVRQKTRPAKYVCGIYRPHFVPAAKAKKLDPDGDFGPNSVYNLQRALGMKPSGVLTKETVKYLQRKAGATADGCWQKGTSKAVQKMVGAKQDGAFGPASVKKLQEWANKVNYPAKKATEAKRPASTAKKTETKKTTSTKTSTATKTAKKTTTKVTNAQKLVNKAKDLAWPYGTDKKKYAYKTGAPRAVCKAAMKKYGWADSKAELSDCGNFVSTIVRESGVDKSFKALHGVKTPFPTKEAKFNIVHKGKAIPSGLLKPGDIIRYKKLNGKQHAMMYFGDGKVCEASHKNLFGVIRKDTKRYTTQSKKKTIQVLRAKE